MKLARPAKRNSRLQARREAHVMSSNESGVRSRWSTGGFRRPGSNKKPFPRGRRKTH